MVAWIKNKKLLVSLLLTVDTDTAFVQHIEGVKANVWLSYMIGRKAVSLSLSLSLSLSPSLSHGGFTLPKRAKQMKQSLLLVMVQRNAPPPAA